MGNDLFLLLHQISATWKRNAENHAVVKISCNEVITPLLWEITYMPKTGKLTILLQVGSHPLYNEKKPSSRT